MSDEDALEHLQIRLMTAEEELRVSTGAIKAAKFVSTDADAFFAKACQEITTSIGDGGIGQDAASVAIRWLARFRQALNESSTKIVASHAERRGEVETLRWLLSSLKVSDEEIDQRQAPET